MISSSMIRLMATRLGQDRFLDLRGLPREKRAAAQATLSQISDICDEAAMMLHDLASEAERREASS